MATMTPTRPPVFNLPNQLTAARFVLALVLFVLIGLDGFWIECTLVFAVAALTDYLDGYFARKQGLSSTLGRVLDPLVDKVLVCGAYIFLLPYGTTEGWLVPWMVTVVVAREMVITSLRSFLENRGAIFGADWLGKLKMGLQCAALIAIFVALYVKPLDVSPSLTDFFASVRTGLIYAMLGATVLSGLQYLWRATLLLRAEGTNPPSWNP
jgi:CDP-diacylglycerol--glycerol-3-phosphate 3-phosphatidyltransferase